MNRLLFLTLAFLCVHKSLASMESIQQKISKVKDVFKKLKENLDFGLQRRTIGSRYTIQLHIPPGPQRYYGAQDDQETARKAVAMIVKEYYNSLELVRDEKSKFPASFHYLKLKYDEMFPKPTNAFDCDAQISKVRKLLKKIKKNPNMCLKSQLTSHGCSYDVRPCIPLGAIHCYGTQLGQAAAQGAALMIVKEYLKSLELVREGKLKSPATANDLQLKYDEMFPNIIASKFENTLKNIERNPNFGIQTDGHRFTIALKIPPEGLYFYGSQYERENARKAVLMIAQEYKKSLDLVQNGKAKSPATKEDLKRKYDAMFSKPQAQIVSKFKFTLKKIEQNPNFGLQRLGRRYCVHLKIPRGKGHVYGSQHDHTTARKAVVMIANEYMKSLEAGPAATFDELKLKYNALLGEIKETQKEVSPSSECDYKEIILNIENGEKNLLMIFQQTPEKPNESEEKNGTTCDNSEMISENPSNIHRNFRSLKTKTEKKDREKLQKVERQPTRAMKQTLRKNEDEENKPNPSNKPVEKLSNKVYKTFRIWNPPEDEPEHDFCLGGYFEVVNPPGAFWVNTIKKVDGRLSGYCKEYGGWVALKYLDFEGSKEVNETLKRKRDESKGFSGESVSEESTRGSDN